MTRGLLSAVAISAIAWVSADARAQAQAQAQVGAGATTAVGGTISEIVVTAQKRSEKLSSVPLSITAITPKILNDSASKNLEELQGIVPGVTFPAATAYGGSSMVIRGTSGSGTFLEDDPVAVYVDGIYQASNSRFGVSDLADVDSVEVVRGPQGTLQGRNATAGAILVRTADPGPDLSGFISGSVATPEEYRVTGAVTLPISDSLRIRLAADHFDQQGWAKNVYDDSHLGGEKATTARAVVIWTPLPRLTARLALNYQQLTSTQASQRWAATAVNPSGVAEDLTNPTPFVSLPAALQKYYLDGDKVYNVSPSINRQKSPSASLEIHYDFGSVEIISLTGLSRASNVGSADSGGLDATGTNGVPLVDATTGELRRAFNQGRIAGNQATEEVRLQSKGDGPLKWLIGVYGSKANDNMNFDIFDYSLAAAGDSDVGFRAHQHDVSKAVFADSTYNITSKLSVTGGIRYTDEDKTFHNAFSVTVPEINLVVVGPIAYAPPTGSWDDVSYRVNMKYQFTRDVMGYISYSKGFKSGGFNAFGVGPTPSYNPETLNSLEIGAKAYFLDRRGYVAISGYDNSYNNLQVTAGVPTGGVNVYNAATAGITGFEVEGQYKLTSSLSLTANAAYTDAHYTQFQNGQGVDGSLIDASGNALPNTPKYQYYVQADYDYDLPAGWRGHAQMSWRWRDKVYFFGTNEEPDLTGAPDGELGARLDFIYKPQSITLSLYAKNLTDTRVVTGEQADFAYPVAFFNEPRVVGAQVTKKF